MMCWVLLLLLLLLVVVVVVALQVLVTTPFQVVCSLCFSFTVYGMAGLREGGEHIIKFGCITTLVYLISVQVCVCVCVTTCVCAREGLGGGWQAVVQCYLWWLKRVMVPSGVQCDAQGLAEHHNHN
jgi:hypothetical protein